MPSEASSERMEEWVRELDSVGLTKEVFESILASSPERDIIPGYPQEKVDYLTLNQNW
jgi:hypothetical protein